MTARSTRVAAEQGKDVLGNEGRVEDLIDSGKKYEKKATEFEGELAKDQKAISDLENQEKAVLDQMLVP